MWVADSILPHNEGLLQALRVDTHREYTLRELILEAAERNEYRIKDFFFSGYHAYLVTDQDDYTEVCDFIDEFIKFCEGYYGAIEFATMLRSKSPEEQRFRPQRYERPLYVSKEGVDELINDVGPKVRLLDRNKSAKKTYTNVGNIATKNKNWAMVVSTSPQQSQTSPITLTTGETKSRFENIEKKLSELTDLYKKDKNENQTKMKKISDDMEEMKYNAQCNYEIQQNNARQIESLIQVMKEQKQEMDELRTMFWSVMKKMGNEVMHNNEDNTKPEGNYELNENFETDIALGTQEASTISTQSSGNSKRVYDETRINEDEDLPPTKSFIMTQTNGTLVNQNKPNKTENSMQSNNLTQLGTLSPNRRSERKRNDHMKKGGQRK